MESKFKITKLTNLFPMLLEYRREDKEGVGANTSLEIYIDFFENQIYVRDHWNHSILIKFSEFRNQFDTENEKIMLDDLESQILATVRPEMTESPIMPQILSSMQKMSEFKSGSYQEFEGFTNE